MIAPGFESHQCLAGMWKRWLGCHAGHQEVGRCSTRGESQGTCNITRTPPLSSNKAEPTLALKPRGVVPEKGLMSSKNLKKKKTSLASTWRVLFLIESKALCFNYYLICCRFSTDGNAYRRCWVLIEDEGLSYLNPGVFDRQHVRDVQAYNKHNAPMNWWCHLLLVTRRVT